MRRNANNPNRPAGTVRTDEEVVSVIAKRNYQLPKAIMLDEFEPPGASSCLLATSASRASVLMSPCCFCRAHDMLSMTRFSARTCGCNAAAGKHRSRAQSATRGNQGKERERA